MLFLGSLGLEWDVGIGDTRERSWSARVLVGGRVGASGWAVRLRERGLGSSLGLPLGRVRT